MGPAGNLEFTVRSQDSVPVTAVAVALVTDGA